MSIFEEQSNEIPGYMYAADIHQVANGKPSIIDNSTWADTTEDFGKFALSAIARGVVSTLNIVPSAANIFGADMGQLETDAVLKSFDDNLAAYYNENRQSVDIVGDVAAMFVPGMAGIKGLNLAQKGLSSLNTGTVVGNNIARAVGTLPSKGKEYAIKAAQKMAETGNVYRITDGNVLKSLASNYAQGALEMAAFEVAASATLSSSPLFEDHTFKDIIYNAALGGGAVGGTIMGSIAGIQTVTQLKSASNAMGRLLAPFRSAKGAEEGVDDFVKVLQLRNEKNNPPIPSELNTNGLSATEIEGMRNQAARALEKRQRDIGIEIQTTLTKMAGGDAEVGSYLSKMLDTMDSDKAWAAMLQLQEMSRLGTVTKLEAEAIGKAAKGKTSDIVVKYLRVAGDDAGSVYNTQPDLVRLADMVGSEKELLKDVQRRISQQPSMGAEWSPIGKNHFDVEARYITAFGKELENGMNIGKTDLPYLEKAVHQKIGATVDGVYMDAVTLREHVKKTKLQLADELETYIAVDPTVSTAVASKLLNVKQGVLEGNGYVAGKDAHFFATTPDDVLTKPSTIKVVYRGDPNVVGVSGNELSGMIQIKQLQEAQRRANEQAVATVLGEDFGRLIKVTDDKVLAAGTSGAGSGFFTMASGEYGTLDSIVEWLGKVTNEVKTKYHKAISEHFQAPAYKFLNNFDAQTEVFALRQAVLSTGEKYVLSEREGVRRMVLKSVDDYERKVIAGKNPVEPIIPEGVVPEIKITSEDAWELMTAMVKHNDEYLAREGNIRNAIGKGMGRWEGVVYFPQPSSKTHPYFSFVVPKNPWQQEQVSMLWARSPEELKTLESAIPHEYRLIRKDDTENYYKMQKMYDAERGMNSRDFISEMRRKGTAAPAIPKTNAEEFIQDLLGHYKQVQDKQVRDAMTLYNNVAFSELRRMDSEFKSLRGSKKPFGGENVGVTPYESYIKTALDIPRSSYTPVWTELNNLAENVVTKVWNSIKSTVQQVKTPEEMRKLNDALDNAGFRGIKDAYTEMIANHPADRRVLSEFVQSANGLFSTLILRTDPMNALNNGIGNGVLTGSEMMYLMDIIKGKKIPEADSFLRELSEVRLPGTEQYIKSPTKLVSRAYKSFFDYLAGDANAAVKFDSYNKNGWLPDMMDQIKSSMDAMTLTGKETSGELRRKISSMMEQTGNILEKGSLNRLAEQMNRYVAAHIADDIAQVGRKYADLGEKEALAFINTFVNRTQGNYVASQRPLMFQGPIGQSISLFMTYQFNMMQHLFRHLGQEGGRKNAAILLGLQSSIYGMNGLPAFNFMNEHLVGNASGNISHNDVYSTAMDIPGVGQWLLYGGLSNATGLGLYSRGDMNPRHVTVVPGSIQDIPFVSATTGFFKSLVNTGSQIAQGADPTSTILRGIEHAGISRPLAGIAQTLNGVYRGDDTIYATTTKNNIVYAQDLYSLATLGRVLGARPLDEAITRDAYYRVQVYEGQDKNKTRELGAAIRDKVNAKSEITDEDIDGFMESYVKSGKDAKNFGQFYQRQVRNAGKNQVQKLVERGNSSYGQYMQRLMDNLHTEPVGLED